MTEEFTDRAYRLPAWHRLKVDEGNGRFRFLTPHEICILAEVFEDAREKYLPGGSIEALGITLGVLKESDE